MQTIGTCGRCGGPVQLPELMVNAVASCAWCHARPREAYGPVIPMQEAPRTNMQPVVNGNTFVGDVHFDGGHAVRGPFAEWTTQ